MSTPHFVPPYALTIDEIVLGLFLDLKPEGYYESDDE
jgi:hypothetical protein